MDLTQYTASSLSSIKDRFKEARYDPTMLVKAGIETIEEITEGKAILMDATNPTVMLLEMGSVLAANCVLELQSVLRKQYPILAQTEDDLYRHMSDEDYLNRFASPSSGTFNMAMQVQSLLSALIYTPEEDCYKAVIARDTEIVVDGVTFTTLYPIVIRRYENGRVELAYDSEIQNPFYRLQNTIIPYTTRKTAALEEWLVFTFEALQVKITPAYFALEKAYNMKQSVTLDDAFYAARAFYKNTRTNGAWVEIKTTHTEQVFDIQDPTIVLKVSEGSLEVQVPIIYLTNDLLSGELRVDVYTTKGALSLPLENYRPDAFTTTRRSIDEERDESLYTVAMNDVQLYLYSTDIVSGGADPISFESLRERVIYNSVGPQNLPITNVQLPAKAASMGFEIVKNVDLITNRVFLATRKLPTPSSAKLITPANVGIVTYTNQLSVLLGYSAVISNHERATIRSKALWRLDNGKLSLLSQPEIDALYAMTQTSRVSVINGAQYFYSPFYYVLDESGSEFEVRVYSLDQPKAQQLNFVQQNQTLQLFVNTGSYELTKTTSGFQLRITTKSGNYYKQLEDGQVGAQLAFYPKDETTYAYLNGRLESVDADKERIFVFDIETNHDLNENNLLSITNASVQGVTNYKAWIDLETTFTIMHYTNSITEDFKADETDRQLGKFMLSPGNVGNTRETLILHFGDALSSLWRRCRSYFTDTVYRRYTEDIPLRYTEDCYEADPITGSIFTVVGGEIVYRVLHRQGDLVFTATGEPVYAHRQGDVILDAEGRPMYDQRAATGREFDLMVVDGRYLFANDPASIAYRSEIESTIVDWVVDEVQGLQSVLLEQSKVFFYPKTSLGTVHVYTENGGEDYLPSEQEIVIDLYVTKDIYNSAELRKSLKDASVTLLETYFNKSVINMREISTALGALYGEAVKAFKVSGLGGAKDYQYVTLANGQQQLCLKKVLTIQADKTLIVEDGVTLEYHLLT